MAIEHHFEEINGLRYHYVTGGKGPAIAFLHGFPDIWSGWRRLMLSFIDAGYCVVAPDWRGFGGTEPSTGPACNTVVDLTADLVAILDKLGIAQTGIVGHDLGSEVGWAAVKMRPDRFGAIVSLSVPYVPRGELSLTRMIESVAPPNFYFRYFLEEGLAEKELDADPRTFLRRIFHTNSSHNPDGASPAMYVGETGLIDALVEPGTLATLPSPEELDVYVEAFTRTGFAGALDTYRSLHRGWELLAVFQDRTVDVPSFYIGGGWDLVLNLPGMRELVAGMPSALPQAEEPVIFPEVGHFIHWERPAEVFDLLLDFFNRRHPER